MDCIETKRDFVKKLARENCQFYGTPDGRGLLSIIDRTFDNRWVYLYELVQNALDAGASSIGIRVAEAGDALIFQHNGDRSLDEKDVEGLSKVFRSTKGARSVGFMGIGFKSVFIRFQEVRISGWDWKFRYEITQVAGEEFGDVQPDFPGAVVPIWDDEIAAPDDGFTTRFEMRRRMGEGTDPKFRLPGRQLLVSLSIGEFDLVKMNESRFMQMRPVLAKCSGCCLWTTEVCLCPQPEVMFMPHCLQRLLYPSASTSMPIGY